MMERLAKKGVRCGVHYLYPAHAHPAYSDPRFVSVSLKHTEEAVTSILSLPMFPELGNNAASQVVAAINSIVGS